MNIILVRNTKSGFGHITLTRGVVLALSVILVLIVPVAFLALGYVVGSKHGTLAPGALYENLRTECNSSGPRLTTRYAMRATT